MNRNTLFRIQYLTDSIPSLQLTERLCIFWQMEGYGEIITGDQAFFLHADELCVLNPATPYSIHLFSGSILRYEINLAFYRTLLPESSHTVYCPLAADNEKLRQTKHLLAQLYHLSTDFSEEKYNLAHALHFSLFHELKLHFSGSVVHTGSDEAAVRLAEIYEYLTLHFSENLSMQQISEHFFISASYLSRFFRRKTQKTVMQALTEIRLAHAATMLTTKSASIEEVCFQCGFPNLHALTAAFRKAYGMTPSEYRRLSPVSSDASSATIPAQVSYYLSAGDETVISNVTVIRYLQSVAVLRAGGGKAFSRNFLHYLYCGPAARFLWKRTQDMLNEMLQMAPFRYLYVSHLLSDDMAIYYKRAGGSFYNFENLDVVCDLILQQHCLPVLELSYMPRQLAKNPENTLGMDPYIASMPSEMSEWMLLIQSLIQHLIDRYGITVVSQFTFTFWNLPDNQHIIQPLSREDFFSLYRHTYRSIKERAPQIRFGLGKLMDTTLESGDWFTKFYQECERNECTPDFLGWGFYALERAGMEVLKTHYQIPQTSLNPGAMSQSYTKICNRLRDSSAALEKHITDWNPCFSTTPLNDSVFRAIYLIHNALTDYPTDTFLYAYSLCDSEFVHNSLFPVFSGWNGLFTINGIPKASAYAYLFLGKLGDILIQKGKGYIVTRTDNSYQILLYHYQHFCRPLPVEELFAISDIDYWDYFDKTVKLNIQLTLTDLPNTQYHWFSYDLSRESGSSYDYWRSIGAPPVDNRVMREHLCHRSHPTIFTQKVTAKNAELAINETLPILSAKLIILTPIL